MNKVQTYTVYGIKNCDTVKKALTWLDKHGISYTFHDYKSRGIEREKLKDWVAQVGVDALLNRKGMTWRKLTDKEQADAANARGALTLMESKTSVIKRPLIEYYGKVVLLGFDPDAYKSLQ